MKKFFVALFIVFVTNVARAYTCSAGYYLNDNNECVACSSPYYCPGDDLQYQCPVTDENFYQWAYDTYGLSPTVNHSYWTRSEPATSPSACVAYNMMQNDMASSIYFAVVYDATLGTYTDSKMYKQMLYHKARRGYYLKQAYSSANNYWQQVAACTNAPANAHYTGAGTNDTYDGTIVDANDCPWECDSGYYNNNGTCTECPINSYCPVGATAPIACTAGLYAPAGMWESAQCGRILHIGNEVVYLRATKITEHALHVDVDHDGVADYFGNMTTADVVMHAGSERKLKVKLDGVIYSIYDDTVTVP